MKLTRKFVVIALLAAVFVSGCKKKRPPVPAAQTQAPSVAAPPPAIEAKPIPPAVAQPPASQKPVEAQAKAPRPKPRPRATPRKPVPASAAKSSAPAPVEQAAAQPSKIVIQEGGAAAPAASSPPHSAAMAHDQAGHHRLTTGQLLDSTEANLRGVGRTLTNDEQAMLGQIRSYMQQARAADKEGDLVRAHNLALKAHLLSDELAKVR